MKKYIIVVAVALVAAIAVYFLFPNLASKATEKDYDFEAVTLRGDSTQNFYLYDSIIFNYDSAIYKSYLQNRNRVDSFKLQFELSPNLASMSYGATSEDDRYWIYAMDKNNNRRLGIGEFSSWSGWSDDTIKSGTAYYSGIFYNDNNVSIAPAKPGLFTRLFSTKSQQEKIWRKLLKDCMKTDQDKRQSYFGVSSFALGTLISKTTLKPTVKLIDIISEVEYKKLIDPQPKGSCSQSLTTGTEFSGAFEAGASLVDAELMAEIIRSKKTTVIPGNYHNTFLLVPALKKLLRNANTQDLLDYKKELFSDENYIILSTKTISGYRADIEVATTSSASLKAKLDSGIVYQVDQLGAELKYKRTSDNKISASSTEKFVPFGEYGKLKRK